MKERKPLLSLWGFFFLTLFGLILWGSSVNWGHAPGIDGGIMTVGIIVVVLLFIGALVVTLD